MAPVDPPLGRVLVLAKADARLIADGVSQPLFTNRWASGAVDPAGYLALESFTSTARSRCGASRSAT